MNRKRLIAILLAGVLAASLAPGSFSSEVLSAAAYAEEPVPPYTQTGDPYALGDGDIWVLYENGQPAINGDTDPAANPYSADQTNGEQPYTDPTAQNPAAQNPPAGDPASQNPAAQNPVPAEQGGSNTQQTDNDTNPIPANPSLFAWMEGKTVKQEFRDDDEKLVMTVTAENVPAGVELTIRDAAGERASGYNGRLAFLLQKFSRLYTTGVVALDFKASYMEPNGTVKETETLDPERTITFTVETDALKEVWEGRENKTILSDNLLYTFDEKGKPQKLEYSVDQKVRAIRFETNLIAPIILVRLGPGEEPIEAEEDLTEPIRTDDSQAGKPAQPEHGTAPSGENPEAAQSGNGTEPGNQADPNKAGQTGAGSDTGGTQPENPAEAGNGGEELTTASGMSLKIKGLPENTYAAWREMDDTEVAALLPVLEAKYNGRRLEKVFAVDIQVDGSPFKKMKTVVIRVPGLEDSLSSEARLYAVQPDGTLEYVDHAQSGDQPDAIWFSAYAFSPFILVQPWTEPEEQADVSGEQPAAEQPDAADGGQTEEPAEPENTAAGDEGTAEQPVTPNGEQGGDNAEAQTPEESGARVTVFGLPEGVSANWRMMDAEEVSHVMPALETAYGRPVKILTAIDLSAPEASVFELKTVEIMIPSFTGMSPEARLFRIWENNSVEYLEYERNAESPDTIRFGAYALSPVVLVQPMSETEAAQQAEPGDSADALPAGTDPAADAAENAGSEEGSPDEAIPQENTEDGTDADENAEATENSGETAEPQTANGMRLQVTGLPEGVSVNWSELSEEQIASAMPAIQAAYTGRQVEVLAAAAVTESEPSYSAIKTVALTVPGLEQLGADARLYGIQTNGTIEYLGFEQSSEQPETVRFSVYTLSPIVLVRPLSVDRLPTVQREITARADDGAQVVISGLLPEAATARIARVLPTETQLQACIGEDAESGKNIIAYDVKILVGNEVWEPASNQRVSVMITPPGGALNVNTGLTLYRLQSGESGAAAKKVNYDLEDGNAVNFSIGGSKGGAER